MCISLISIDAELQQRREIKANPII